MASVVVSRDSWLSRMAKSVAGVGIGSILFLVSFIVLFWNEGRAVQTEKSLTEGAGTVKSVPAEKVDPSFESKLVHLTGTATTAETLDDTEFKVSAPNAIKLERTVEMYQWRENSHTEERKRAGGSVDRITTYDYEKTWSATQIDSEGFHESDVYVNPHMPYSSQNWTAQKVTLGAFTMSNDLVEKYNERQELPMAEVNVKALPKSLGAKLENTSLFIGHNSAEPEIGDVRVSYHVVKPGPVSVVAVQAGSTFTPWKAPSGDDVLLLQSGTVQAAAMFEQAQSDNNTTTFVLRIVGWAMMFFGMMMVLKPLSVMGDVVPLIGSLIGAGVGVVSFATASALSTITLGIAWLFYRPLQGIAFLAVGGALIFGLFRYAKKKKGSAGVGQTVAVA